MSLCCRKYGFRLIDGDFFHFEGSKLRAFGPFWQSSTFNYGAASVSDPWTPSTPWLPPWSISSIFSSHELAYSSAEDFPSLPPPNPTFSYTCWWNAPKSSTLLEGLKWFLSKRRKFMIKASGRVVWVVWKCSLSGFYRYSECYEAVDWGIGARLMKTGSLMGLLGGLSWSSWWKL